MIGKIGYVKLLMFFSGFVVIDKCDYDVVGEGIVIEVGEVVEVIVVCMN